MDGSSICLEFTPAPLREVLDRVLRDAGAHVSDGGGESQPADCHVVYCDEESSWKRAAELAPFVSTVVVIPRLDFDLIVRALAVGAGVAVLDTPTEVFADVVRGALRAEAIVPLTVSTALARHEPPARADVMAEPLTELESRLLQQVADGATNGAIADSLGYSGRTVTRRLQGLYLKLGVRNRNEAIVKAAQR